MKRAIDPGALGWLAAGTVLAGLAWILAPRFGRAPMHLVPWLPILAMIVAPALAWAVWRLSRAPLRQFKSGDRTLINPAWRSWLELFVVTWLGFGGYAARRVDPRTRDERGETIIGMVALLRRRVAVWTMSVLALLSLHGFAEAMDFVSPAEGTWNKIVGTYSRVLKFSSPLGPLREHWAGELLLTLTLCVAASACLWAAFLLFRMLWRLINSGCERIADWCVGSASQLQRSKANVIWRVVCAGLAGVAVLVALAFLTIFLPRPYNWLVDADWPIVIANWAGILVAISAWHAWTLRRFARALVGMRAVVGKKASQPEAKPPKFRKKRPPAPAAAKTAPVSKHKGAA